MNPMKGSSEKALRSTFVVDARTMKPHTEDVLAGRNTSASSAKLVMTIVKVHGLVARGRITTMCA